MKKICLNCNSLLTEKKNKLICNKCNYQYKIINEIPLLMFKKLTALKESEKQFYSKEFSKAKNLSFEYVEKSYLKDDWNLMKYLNFLEKLPKDARILELGAGNGQYGLILKKKGFKNVVITDISAAGLNAAKEYAKKKGLPWKDSFYAVDAENLPFEDKSFDAIFIVAALHHMENIPKTISEIKRCLKNGGLGIIAVEPNKWYFKIIRPIGNLLGLRRIQKEESSLADEKTKGFNIKELESYLSDFKIITNQKIWYLTGIIYYLPTLMKRAFNLNLKIPPQIRRLTNKIDKIIEKIPIIKEFSFHITLIVRKP